MPELRMVVCVAGVMYNEDRCDLLIGRAKAGSTCKGWQRGKTGIGLDADQLACRGEAGIDAASVFESLGEVHFEIEYAFDAD